MKGRRGFGDILFPGLGLRGRYTFYGALMTSALVLLLTAQSYLNARSLTRGLGEQQLHSVATLMADRIAQDISIASRDVRALADQPLLANALLDSEGREAYLRPFIARHELPADIDYNLVLVDYSGAPIIARKTMSDFTGRPWIESAIGEGLSYAGMERRGEDALLRIAVPVFYRLSGTYEGVLVFEMGLAEWLDRALGEHREGIVAAVLRSGGAPVVERTWQRADAMVSASEAVRADLPTALELSLQVSLDEAHFEQPLRELLWRHLGWGAALVLLVGAASAVVARALTRRVEALSAAAQSLAHGRSTDGQARPGWQAADFGQDEIGRLADSLFRLFGELRTQQGELEALVASRTADLAAREADLNRAQSIAGIGSWVYHPASGLLEASPEMVRLCGVTPGRAFFLHDLLRMVAPEDRRLVERAWAEVAKGVGFSFEHRLVVAGECRWVHAQCEAFLDGAGRLLRAVGTMQDVTARHLAEARMREALAVFEASPQGIMTTDGRGVIVSANPAFCRITGYAVDEVVGRRPSLLRSGRHDDTFYGQMWQALRQRGLWEGEIWNRRKNGEVYPQWLTISAVRDETGDVSEFVALFSDISERKQQEELIWRQANFDVLTGLANRSLLHDRMQHALAQARRSGQRVGVLFVDLDGFKWVNDTLGHDAGDALLVEVAHRLKACVREQDTVARLGGDEFTLVVAGLQEPDVLSTIGHKALAVLRDPFTLNGSAYHLSGSVGITVFPDDGDDSQALLRNADIAMYKSKHAGKNRLSFYAPQMQEDVTAHLRLEAELRAAVQHERFVLRYQPIVEADSGMLVGTEALIRWQHPKRGLVEPAEFIPAAEECGLIGAIGEWVLRSAARQWRAWRDAHGRAMQLAVNVSGLQFRDAGLPELVRSVLAEYGVEASCITLEISESVLIDGSPQVDAAIREIESLGVAFALDDFGTGFSSLSYLRRFPADVVKIDRSFVCECPDDRNDAHLVEAIINMAHSLGLTVTAEGVETEAQRAFLRGLGCDHLQGYLIGRPMSAADIASLLACQRPLAA